ncbi:TPA: head completion/stabilization protein [Escherichia coli]|nr:major capsid protein [Escherichia coli]SQQ75377.1 major capsid protein [Escherichia coli]SQS55750.1 major capsid protein [Escherichia coli]HAI7636130.1 head completion/stabilization protein [Escherichia coli]HAN3974630.1 head completion/stabilization protein [Escherichia coli]
MRQETRFKFNAYLSRVAELNGIDAGDVSKKFTVEPSVTQTLMNTMQESSDFLTRINIVPVSEMKGEKIGIGVTGSIASTTDTAGGTERQPKDFSKLASNKYECDQINFDFYIRYKTLDLWARYQDFQLRVRNAIIKRQSLDLIMAGFNGVRRAETSDRSSNPMLQDVAVGWLQKYRNEAPARVMSKVTDEEGHTTSEVIRVNHLTLHRRPPPDFSEVVMMTLIIPRKEAPVSGEGTVVIPQPAGDEPVIKNTFFFPDIDPKRVRERMRLEQTVAPARLREAIKSGMAETNAELYEYREQKIAAGFTRLADVPADDIDGESIKVFYYERAVCAMATASLYERYRGVDASAKGDKKADSIDSTIDELWRDMRWAVARIQDKPRCIVSQI